MFNASCPVKVEVICHLVQIHLLETHLVNGSVDMVNQPANDLRIKKINIYVFD